MVLKWLAERNGHAIEIVSWKKDTLLKLLAKRNEHAIKIVS